MSELRFTQEQILSALRRADFGVPVPEICREVGCSEAIFCVWAMLIGNGVLTDLGFHRSRVGETTTKRGLTAAKDLACGPAVAYASSDGSGGRLWVPHCVAGCPAEDLAPGGADSRQLVGRPATRHPVIPRVV